MKRLALLLSLALGLALAPEAHAQRTLPGMRGLEVRAGMADGWYSASGRSTTGYYFGAAMSRYAGRANKWVFGAEYLCRNYPYKAGSIPVAQFTGEGGYYYKFLADGSKTFFLYIGGSVLLGYETVNWGESLLPDGSRLTDEDNFIYGGALTLELSAYMTDKIVLLVNGRQRVLFGGDCGKFHTQVGVGIRFMIR